MLRQGRDFSTIDAVKRWKRGTMEAGKNSVIYMGLISEPNKADDTCGKTMVTGTMDRGFTVYSKGTARKSKYIASMNSFIPLLTINHAM
jgi:hypothetical protein